MEDSIPADTRYIPLTQQKWLCVPTCIQIIMLRYNIPLITSEAIASFFNIIVPEEDKELFWHITTGPRPSSGYGTQMKEIVSANNFFQKMKIPLKMEWKLIDQFQSLEMIYAYLKTAADKDILVCFDNGILFDEDTNQGHVCVLDKVFLDKGEVRLIDPDAESPKWRYVLIEKLYKAMQYHSNENSAGFWEISAL